MSVSNKKKKAIVRGFPKKSVKELSRELGLTPGEVKSALKDAGKVPRSSRKRAAYITLSVSFLAAVLIGVCLYFSRSALNFQAGGGEDKSSSRPVLLIGLDGLAWRVVTPMIHGKEYPWVRWSRPLDLSTSPLEYLTGKELSHSGGGRAHFSGGVLDVDRLKMPEVWGVSRTFRRSAISGERGLFEAEARSLVSKSKLTLAVRFQFPGGEGVSDSGNNETLWRTFELGEEWSEVSIEFQLPTTARLFSLVILPYQAKVSPKSIPGPPDSLPLESQRFQVRGLSLVPGEIRGLPEGGYDFSNISEQDNQLPNLSRLMKRGSYGHLANLSPANSPVIWTSVATGERPSRHGITTFFMKAPGTDGKVLASSSLRKVPAIWNVVSDYGDDSVGVAGWWASWPAEKVDGFVISDHANDAALKIMKDKDWMPTEDEVLQAYEEYYTYPSDLLESIRSRFKNVENITKDELTRFIPQLDDATWKRFKNIDRVDKTERLSHLKFYYARDMSLHRSIKHLWGRRNPDLWLIYYQGTDVAEHMYWHWEDPAIFPRVDPEKARKYGKILEGYYRLVDEMVGEYMQKAGPDATYIVASDHGHYPVDFMQVRDGGPRGHHRWHSPGIFIAAGPAIKEDHYTSQARIYDIMPTVMYLMDYPVATSIEGRVLRDIIRPGWAESHQMVTIPRYEYLADHFKGDAPVRSRFNREIKDRMKALGYLQ